MYKLIFIGLIVTAVALYFTGALNFGMNGDNIDVSIDKNKAKELGESINDKLAK